MFVCDSSVVVQISPWFSIGRPDRGVEKLGKDISSTLKVYCKRFFQGNVQMSFFFFIKRESHGIFGNKFVPLAHENVTM